MEAKSRIVVFGGAGFIGSHLLRRLAATTDHDLVSVDIKDPKFRTNGVTYLRHDVRDLTTLDIKGDIERIYNLAAVHVTPGHEPHEYYETNIRGANEITAFARRKNVKALTFTSSISVYGPGEETKTEAAPVSPKSPYGWSKWLAEHIHRSWQEEDADRRLVICRPAVVFGKAEGGNFTRLARLLRKGFFVYPGRRDTIKACFYVGDLIDALFFAQAQKSPYTLFNGCYPDRHTLEDIVEAFGEKHFPAARTFLLPRVFVSAMAHALKPLSTLGLGIHPDRVTKLVRSTDVMPAWLEENGKSCRGGLESALDRWSADTDGAFD